MSRAPKRTPRERLLDWAASENWSEFARFKRLLRAHERDLAERAVRAAACFPDFRHDHAIRAAILGPKRGRRA